MGCPTARRRSGSAGWCRVLSLLIGLAATGFLPVSPALATDDATIVSIGESNSESQRAELLDLFGTIDSTVVIDVTVSETLQTWEGIFDLTGVDSAYSSTALTCDSSGAGVEVTTSNIEVVPPELYALALVTAGLTDVRLVVAAPDDAPALGMTALTGVFKTWDQSPCAGMGNDPERRQLALEQMALVAGIGESRGGIDAIRSATGLVLSLQRSIVQGDEVPAGLEELVAERAPEYGIELGADEQAAVVDVLERISGTGIDWRTFADDWTVDYSDEDTRVVMRPGAPDEDEAVEAVPTGVGGRIDATEPPSPVPTATVAPAPTATPREVMTPTPVATATQPVAAPVGPTDIGDPTTGGGADNPFPWWLLLGLIPLGLLALLIVARRRRRIIPIPARVSRSLASEAVARRRAGESEVAAATVVRSETAPGPVMAAAFPGKDQPSGRVRTGRIARRIVDTRLSRR